MLKKSAICALGIVAIVAAVKIVIASQGERQVFSGFLSKEYNSLAYAECEVDYDALKVVFNVGNFTPSTAELDAHYIKTCDLKMTKIGSAEVEINGTVYPLEPVNDIADGNKTIRFQTSVNILQIGEFQMGFMRVWDVDGHQLIGFGI